MTGNYILFDNTIPVSTDSAIIERTRKLFEPVPLKDFSNGALLNVLELQGYFSLSSDIQVNRRIKDAFGIILRLYMTNERAVNLSIAVNFSTKILLWFGNYGKQIRKKSPHNPKVIYWGSPKKHEIYFLILMSLIGCDVLVLNTSFKDKFDKVDKHNEYSKLIKHSKELPLGPFPAKKLEEHSETKITLPDSEKPEKGLKINRLIKQEHNQTLVQEKSLSASLLNAPTIIVKLKRTEMVFEEMLVPLNKRSGYVGDPYPILPTYFVRYIGVPTSSDDWEAEYFNSLYNLNKAFQMTNSYLKFLEGIPAPSAVENAAIPHSLRAYPFRDHLEIIEQILRAGLLPLTNDELLDNTIKKTFLDTVNLFSEKTGHGNISIIFNFSIKMISWLNRYLPQLVLKGNSNKTILFYGPIKTHEIYLLNALHKIGCDVLFVHSEEEGDKPFRSFDPDDLLSHLIRNKHDLPLASFPKGERVIRKGTIAYKASKEIEEVIYGEEVGLFKPWQFEKYGTQPITLKTTYDELKILWKEPAKLRPEFKIQNKKVYVPNLFAKIQGVSENLEAYWQDLKTLSAAPNVKLIEGLPFTRIPYTKQELYQSNYLLNKQGLLDEFKVVKNRHYKFGYLKAPLQQFLIKKINELIFSGMFLTSMDEKFKLKIIMTILTVEDHLLKLIEVFDYPQEVPKVIVYDNAKETFSEADAILIAYFNLIGLDIAIFTPTNYKTIEHHIKPSLFDLHQLPLVKYDLLLPALDNIPDSSAQKPGLLSRFFNFR